MDKVEINDDKVVGIANDLIHIFSESNVDVWHAAMAMSLVLERLKKHHGVFVQACLVEGGKPKLTLVKNDG